MLVHDETQFMYKNGTRYEMYFACLLVMKVVAKQSVE
jgi:hypothetical protein